MLSATPPLPSWSSDLLDEVERAFQVTGAATPGWPHPHPDRQPREEEYSRCLDPGKYRILPARTDAWARALATTGLATMTVDAGPAEVRHLASGRPGALALDLATVRVDGEPFGLELSVVADGRPPARLDLLPDCGCDACDVGSDDLLEHLDGWVLTVARGGVVHASDGTSSMSRTIDGWSGRGDVDASWLEDREAPPGVRRWTGLPWR